MILSYSEREERKQARIAEYLDGTISETVLSASLFALGMRGDDLKIAVREQVRIRYERNAKARHQQHSPAAQLFRGGR